MTTPYTRTVYATDSAAAQRAVSHMAKRDGLRVRTVQRVALVPSGTYLTPPRYTVTLAVDAMPALRDEVSCE
jgi:hypothetical protein